MTQVRERIDASGLSLDTISKISGIAGERLTAFQQGQEPSLAELRRLAEALGLTIADFLPDTEPEHRVKLLFRQTATKRPKADVPDVFSKRVAQALEVLSSDSAAVPWVSQKVDQAEAENAEKKATAFRERFFERDQRSPLLSLPNIASSDMGIVLYLIDHAEVEGASAIVSGQPFIFLARRTFKPRMLFTLAHELGHLLARQSEGGELAFIDLKADVQQLRPRRRKAEGFADEFASCLLLPAAGVGAALKRIKELTKADPNQVGDIELLYLARFFGVSFDVAAYRCERLNLLPSGGAYSLHEHLSKRGGPEKYAEELGLPPRPDIKFPTISPRLLHDSIENIRRGRLSIGKVSAILNLSIPDILQLHGGGAWQSP